MIVPTPSGSRVPLASLGAFTYEGGRGQILRRQRERQRREYWGYE